MKFVPPALFLLLLFTACQSDDTTKAESSLPSLSGTWLLVGWYDEEPRDINNDGVASTNLFDQWNGCKKHSKLILNGNGMGEIIYTGPENNPNCPNDFHTNDSFGAGPWEVDDPPIIFSLIGDDFVDSYIIESLTAEELVLQGSGFITCCDESISYFTGGFLRFERE